MPSTLLSLRYAAAALALSAHTAAASETFSGRATTYGLVSAIGGSCSVRLAPFGLDPALFVAMNGDQYASSSACSRCLRLKGPKGTVTTFVADVCFECGHGNLDLNTALWDTVVGGDPRVEPISWQYTPCPDEKEKFCMKEGSNPQWLALQVANSRDGVQAVEIGGHKAEVIGITSFYQASGAGVNLDLSKLEVKITSTSGITSKATLNSAASFEGCAMPSNDDNQQSNNNGGASTVAVDVTGVTEDLSAWRAYRRRHAHVY